jgi:hypothetical protein
MGSNKLSDNRTTPEWLRTAESLGKLWPSAKQIYAFCFFFWKKKDGPDERTTLLGQLTSGASPRPRGSASRRVWATFQQQRNPFSYMLAGLVSNKDKGICTTLGSELPNDWFVPVDLLNGRGPSKQYSCQQRQATTFDFIIVP